MIIRQKGFLKLKFVVIPKKYILPNNSQAMDEVEFFCQFPDPWVFWESGIGC
jgi:hypothetical protein